VTGVQTCALPISLVGESGSGKSVTALTIAGLLQGTHANIDSGKILFTTRNGREKDLQKLKEKEYRKIRGNNISMIFQEPMTSLNPVMKCGKQVSEVIRLHKRKSRRESKNMTLQLFSEVHLPRREEIYNSYPHEISGGQKQRVMIAMAIACRPDLLIADEPTTALDVTVQKNIVDLLKQIQRNYGMSVLFISHDLGVVAEIADHIAIMKNGKIVEKATAGKILNDPENPYTKGLLACRPRIDISLKRLPTIDDFMRGSKEWEYPDNLLSPGEKNEIGAGLMKKEPFLK
jgi:peptide/nickel transport system ATP-binding protein